uniref:Uncharacterized protein n=1 Tax=Oryza sativa subsp. japonica TaxID=39947 RepID=Q67UA3_ORYSJ|nr:hypothetical protein [Oryza sativa Japonica Group]
MNPTAPQCHRAMLAPLPHRPAPPTPPPVLHYGLPSPHGCVGWLSDEIISNLNEEDFNSCTP